MFFISVLSLFGCRVLYSPTTAYAYGEVFATEISSYVLKRLGEFSLLRLFRTYQGFSKPLRLASYSLSFKRKILRSYRIASEISLYILKRRGELLFNI